MIASINPATGETLRAFEALTEGQIEDRLRRAAAAYQAYRRTSFAERARWLNAAGEILESEKDRLGRVMTLEMGKNIGAARPRWLNARGRAATTWSTASDCWPMNRWMPGAGRSFIRYEPIGPVLAVMPWNFPFWQAFRFAAPALMAGNVGLLKHASNVPQCALAIEEIIRRAGFRRTYSRRC